MEIEDRAAAQPREFVLLAHLMPAHAPRGMHWDLMIDLGKKLLTLELRELPGRVLGECPQRVDATRLADHRREYLRYEGPLSAGAQGEPRGSVERVAAGHAQCQVDASTEIVRCRLTAPRLAAEFEFRQCAVGESTQLLIGHWQWLDAAT